LLILNAETLTLGLETLAQRDSDLAAVLARLGPPPMWTREPGFPTLLRIILEQQVSLASARATFDRLCALASPLTPASFLALGEETLRAAGFSRQKSRYGRELAQAVLSGRLNLDALGDLPDDEVRAALIAIPGIGPWSAEIYLLMALHRADAWPVSDLGVIVGLQQVKRLPNRPTREEADRLAEPWRPWRSVATRLLWYNYLGGITSNA
jgi:DNA-3-methyladenine glycosylase II